MEAWKAFYDKADGRELCAYMVRGSIQGEETATVDLLAYENGIKPEQITATTENR